jgi:uncharacterized protein YcbK (DUF882 family)
MPVPVRALAAPAAIAAAVAALGMSPPARSLAPVTWSSEAAARPDPDAAVRLGQRAFGRSAELRVVTTDPRRPLSLPIEWTAEPAPEAVYRWLPVTPVRAGLLGGEVKLATGLVAPAEPGIYRLSVSAPGFQQVMNELQVITLVPFSEKRRGYLNGYRIGAYETETDGIVDAYAPPSGFIEVTPENQDLQVSTHFRLRNFLTKDQFGVWPKYLALDMRLIDKLELVLQELNAMGVRAENVAVMSGFRTPAYNVQGLEQGRALLSRHTYGDASDVWIDNDRDGYMDDLNGDGRRDTDDVLVIRRAVDRVEERFPELKGGAGVYPDNGAHGPFIHIDARGTFSRW